MNNNKFSKEFLFRECNLHNHCIALHLTEPFIYKQKREYIVYMTSIVLTHQQEKMLLKNIADKKNTFGVFEAKILVGDENKPVSINISTDKIDYTEIKL